MVSKKSRKVIREKRHYKIRRHINGTAVKPRLSVYKSNGHIYAQIIDDVSQTTIVSASTLDKEIRKEMTGMNTRDVAAATFIGKRLADRAIEKGIKEVVFDRGGYVYHGKVQALADGAREKGLQF